MIVGSLPTRFVQTRKVPFGVLIGIILTPPREHVVAAGVIEVPRLPGAAADDAARSVVGAAEHAQVAMTTHSQNVRRFMMLFPLS